VVILLTGRHAGKKAVIVKASDDGSGSRPYGHALVVGLDKAPRKVIRKASEAKQAKAAKLRTFIKVVNYQVRFCFLGVSLSAVWAVWEERPGKGEKAGGFGELSGGPAVSSLGRQPPPPPPSPPLLSSPPSHRPSLIPPSQKKQQHLMPTRYSLEIDLKAAVPADCVGNAAKLKAARGEAKAIFEEKFKTGANRWFFTKLAF
jgi:ribosomal protein L14E/L6E/L27E